MVCIEEHLANKVLGAAHVPGVQGHLAHKKPRPLRTQQ